MRFFGVVSFLLFFGFSSEAQEEVWMHPNEGQWHENIEYKVDLLMGEFYIEKDGFTYNLTDLKQHKNHAEGEEDHHDEATKYHTIYATFLNSSWNGELEKIDSSSFYRNYILGNDQSKWKSKLYSYSHLLLHNYYNGIDLDLSGKNGDFKYSFILSPNSNVEQIEWVYRGQDRLAIDEGGNLIVSNRFGEIIESKPIAWTESNGKKTKVELEFILEDNKVSFHFPNGYNEGDTLTIDPSLSFSSFTGAETDNWGMTATPDQYGNLVGGGISFGIDYPATPGAYDMTFNGGGIDLGITKFTADGTALVYSTYIGGAGGAETPNSIVSSFDNDELYIFGVTSSGDFPMAGSSFDNTFASGPSIPTTATNNLNFTGGADIYIARLSADGTTLLSSTFLGGTGTDGINTTSLQYNYGDQFRGEIILDENNDVFVTSLSTSSNFPITTGPGLNGSQDAVVFKMSSDLSSLDWARFIGGGLAETGNSIQIASDGTVFIAGGTNSANMPFTVGNDLTFGGGIADGYLARIDGTNGTLLSGTYIGASEYDQAYFVQLDIDDEVYVLGQSESNYGVTAGLYGVPNSGQFIRKYSNNLGTIQWTTMIGAGSGSVEISPTAFLVSDCYDIYLSGWGGVVNAGSQATNSSSNNFPVTPDAYQPSTSGDNFYLAVLAQDAAYLKYATYMGGLTGYYNHVDGGTSRFDKSGTVYHAVCAACSGQPNGFTTTPGVYGPTNNSTNCNMAVFKFDLNVIEAVVSAPIPLICLPDPVYFINNSVNGNQYLWDFGDNTTSTEFSPSHVYPGAGTYIVTLVVSDSNNCFVPDQVTFEVVIGDFQGGVIQPTEPICPGSSYQMEAYGGSFYEWSPAQFLDDPSSPTPFATITETTEFQVVVSDSCGIDTVYATLEVFQGEISVSNDTSICIGNNIDLFVEGGVSAIWSPATYLDDPNSFTPNSTPDTDITYTVDVVTFNGCELQETVNIGVYYDPPIPILIDQISVCEGSSVEVTCSGGESYFWSPPIGLNTTSGPTVTITPDQDRYYYVSVVNACGDSLDSIYVDVVTSNINAGNDTIICPGESAVMWATGGVAYSWQPSGSLNSSTESTVIATPTETTLYTVIGIDENGCTGQDQVLVELFPHPYIWTNPDIYAFYDEEVQLIANSATPGPYVWWPTEYLSCVACSNPTATPNEDFTYYVSYTDINGCSATDSISIFYEPFIYIPNTFTPDGNEFNNGFRLEGGNFENYEILIYNRWGELIYTIEGEDDFWDGTYKGVMCQDGTYIWKLRLLDLNGEIEEYVGHVNLLR